MLRLSDEHSTRFPSRRSTLEDVMIDCGKRPEIRLTTKRVGVLLPRTTSPKVPPNLLILKVIVEPDLISVLLTFIFK